MAFSFSGGAASTPSIFGSSTPAFGASSNPAFGASSTPAFGASSASSLFGSAFGAASTPAFGSQAQQSNPAFGFSASTGSLFGGSSAGSLFGGAAPAFGSTQQPQQQGAFGFGQQSTTSFGLALAPQQQPGQQQQQHAGGLATADNKPLTHYTKWEEIGPEGQKQLLQLENLVSQAREECRQLDRCPRLQDSQEAEPSGAEDALRNTLQGFTSFWRSDEEAIVAFNERVHTLLHDTEVAVRAFQRSYRWREAAKASQGQALPPAVREMLNGPVVLPSLYLRTSVNNFQELMAQYQSMVAELERVLPDARQRAGAEGSDVLRALPAALNNVHDLLMHVAARIDALHERVLRARDDWLEEQRQVERMEQLKGQAARAKQTVIPPARASGASHTAQHASSAPLLTYGTPGVSPHTTAGGISQPSLFGAAPVGGSSLFGGQAGAPGLGAAFGGASSGGDQGSRRKGKTRK